MPWVETTGRSCVTLDNQFAFPNLPLVCSGLIDVFFGFSMPVCSESVLVSTLLMLMLLLSEQLILNCTILLPNTRTAYTVVNSFTVMPVSLVS